MKDKIDGKPVKKKIEGRWRTTKNFLTKKRHFYKPYIEFYLDLGFVRFKTSVMHRAYERYVYDYIRVDWKLFKWSGGFSMYKPGVDL